MIAPFAGFGLGLRKPHYAEFLDAAASRSISSR